MLYIFVSHKVFWDLAFDWSKLLHAQIIREIPDSLEDHLVIMFGLNSYQGQMPKYYIAVQLEQTPQSGWFTEKYLDTLRKAVVIWDYSITNIKNLQTILKCKQDVKNYQFGLKCVTIGYTPTPQLSTEKKYDILFLGQINARRGEILDALKQKGFTCYTPSDIWGKERDVAIQQSRLVVNIHYYENAILETTRLSLLLSNRACVVSETSLDMVLDCQYKKFVELVEHSKFIETVSRLLQSKTEMQKLQQKADLFRRFETNLPINELLEPFSRQITSRESNLVKHIQSSDKLEGLITNSSDIQLVKQTIHNGTLTIKLDLFDDSDLPSVSIITVTRNRQKQFRMPIRNFYLFKYPSDKLEWIIVDDSPPTSTQAESLEAILPKDPRIHLIKLYTKQLDQEAYPPFDIGYKRNIGIKKAKYDYLVMMDDDDYYYPISIYSRIAILLTYPEYGCVGVADLYVYDLKAQSCACFQSPYLSEASMAFTRKFWIAKPFPEKENPMGEGAGFTDQRRNEIVKMPSCFNLIAVTHGSNFTGNRRSIRISEKLDLFKALDFQTKLFFIEWSDTWEGVATSHPLP